MRTPEGGLKAEKGWMVGKRMEEGLPEEQLSISGQQGLDLYQDVQAAPCVCHFILQTRTQSTGQIKIKIFFQAGTSLFSCTHVNKCFF